MVEIFSNFVTTLALFVALAIILIIFEDPIDTALNRLWDKVKLLIKKGN